MDMLDVLRRETRRAQEEYDLPDFLAERIFRLADHPERCHDCREDMLKLIEQVGLYDTYGQTGYLGMGVSNSILEGTIRRLEEKTGLSGD